VAPKSAQADPATTVMDKHRTKRRHTMKDCTPSPPSYPVHTNPPFTDDSLPKRKRPCTRSSVPVKEKEATPKAPATRSDGNILKRRLLKEVDLAVERYLHDMGL